MRIPMDRFSFTLCLRIAISFSFVAQGSITTAAERRQAFGKTTQFLLSQLTIDRNLQPERSYLI